PPSSRLSPYTTLFRSVTNVFETLEGCSTIELALHSGEEVTDRDRRMLEHLLPICERRGLNIALYHHARYGMQTTSAAVALCEERSEEHTSELQSRENL